MYDRALDCNRVMNFDTIFVWVKRAKLYDSRLLSGFFFLEFLGWIGLKLLKSSNLSFSMFVVVDAFRTSDFLGRGGFSTFMLLFFMTTFEVSDVLLAFRRKIIV